MLAYLLLAFSLLALAFIVSWLTVRNNKKRLTPKKPNVWESYSNLTKFEVGRNIYEDYGTSRRRVGFKVKKSFRKKEDAVAFREHERIIKGKYYEIYEVLDIRGRRKVET